MKTQFRLIYTLVLLLVVSVTNSCNTTSNSIGGSVVINWNLNIDGQSYSWSGTYPPSANQIVGSNYFLGSNNQGNIVLANSNSISSNCQMMISQAGMSAIGQYSFSPTSSVTDVVNITITEGSVYNPRVYNSTFGGTVKVNITSFPSGTIANYSSNSAILIGNFSGTIGRETGGVCSVSGTFQAIRTQ